MARPTRVAETDHMAMPLREWEDFTMKVVRKSGPGGGSETGDSGLREGGILMDDHGMTERCSECGTADFSDGEYRDWADDPHYAYCLKCAAGVSGAQWKSPGDVIGGDASLSTSPTVSERFLAFHSAEFWAMVWEGRVKYPTESHGRQANETVTAEQLTLVEQAFESDDWERGFKLLEPIGAPGWGERSDPPLFAWQPENCRRVSQAWIRLREHRLNQLPESIIEVVRQRGPRQDSIQREMYEREQREIEEEAMYELRDELSGNVARRRQQQEMNDLNEWIQQGMERLPPERTG